MKVVDNFSSKLGIPMLETVDSLDSDHMQMARCNERSDESYRFISGVLKRFLRRGHFDEESSKNRPAMPLGSPTKMQREEASKATEDVENRKSSSVLFSSCRSSIAD